MEAIVADTHALLWYLFEPEKLSETARDKIKQSLTEGSSLCFSAISLVEIIYLTEKGRLPSTFLPHIIGELETKNTILKVIPVDFQIALALQKINRASIPDMPDRIIAATAIALDVPLITRDHKIRISEIKTIW